MHTDTKTQTHDMTRHPMWTILYLFAGGSKYDDEVFVSREQAEKDIAYLHYMGAQYPHGALMFWDGEQIPWMDVEAMIPMPLIIFKEQ